MNDNLCKIALDNNGSIHPLVIDAKYTGGLGICNPSIFDNSGKLLVNIRSVNYTLHHNEGNRKFQTPWGPLCYIRPDNDEHLRTENILCTLDHTLNIDGVAPIIMKKLHNPCWEFTGLEDVRVVKWDDRLFFCGGRRDIKRDGEGRIEFSEIVDDKEINRYRIQPPNGHTYLEKNWLPINELPYHFIRWSNPMEIVKVDLDNLSSEVIYKSDITHELPSEIRGSSNVINIGDKWIYITHEVDFWHNEKKDRDAQYYHRFITLDKNWNIINISEKFKFMGAAIEFCCGMEKKGDDLLITFGFMDNAAYILRVSINAVIDIIENKKFNNNIKPLKKYWNVTEWPTMEITTTIPKRGCVVDCVFCPQEILKKAYVPLYGGERFMTMKNFKKSIDKLPTEVRVTFSGFVEPWMNKYCSDMILYAHETGHRVSVFTTGIGMSLEDVEKIKDIPFCGGPNGGFTLHLPDDENLAKHPITDKYLDVLSALKNANINNFMVMCMGNIHDSVKSLFSNVPTYDMWSRGGNLTGEAILKPQLLDVMDRVKSTYQDGDITCGCDEDLYHNILLPNGDVSLCCMDYGLDHILGNLYTEEYEKIMPENNTTFSLCNYCENGIPK